MRWAAGTGWRFTRFASGNISRTSELLGVTRPTLYDLMEKLGIRVSEDEAAPAPVTRPTSASG